MQDEGIAPIRRNSIEQRVVPDPHHLRAEDRDPLTLLSKERQPQNPLLAWENVRDV